MPIFILQHTKLSAHSLSLFSLRWCYSWSLWPLPGPQTWACCMCLFVTFQSSLLPLPTKAQQETGHTVGVGGHSTQGMGVPNDLLRGSERGAFPAASGQAFWWESTMQLELCPWVLTHTLSLFCTKRIAGWGSSLLALCCTTLVKGRCG